MVYGCNNPSLIEGFYINSQILFLQILLRSLVLIVATNVLQMHSEEGVSR